MLTEGTSTAQPESGSTFGRSRSRRRRIIHFFLAFRILSRAFCLTRYWAFKSASRREADAGSHQSRVLLSVFPPILASVQAPFSPKPCRGFHHYEHWTAF